MQMQRLHLTVWKTQRSRESSSKKLSPKMNQKQISQTNRKIKKTITMHLNQAIS